jgi:hypothetical protein
MTQKRQVRQRVYERWGFLPFDQLGTPYEGLFYHPESFDRLTMHQSKDHPEPVEGWFDEFNMQVSLSS